MEVSAFRIVQEALTNVRRHGDGTAEPTLRFTPDTLDLELANAVARPAPRTADGRGLAGMRGRAVLVGGHLTRARRATGAGASARCPLDARAPA